jgi:hypothetical protein
LKTPGQGFAELLFFLKKRSNVALLSFTNIRKKKKTMQTKDHEPLFSLTDLPHHLLEDSLGECFFDYPKETISLSLTCLDFFEISQDRRFLRRLERDPSFFVDPVTLSRLSDSVHKKCFPDDVSFDLKCMEKLEGLLGFVEEYVDGGPRPTLFGFTDPFQAARLQKEPRATQIETPRASQVVPEGWFVKLCSLRFSNKRALCTLVALPFLPQRVVLPDPHGANRRSGCVGKNHRMHSGRTRRRNNVQQPFVFILQELVRKRISSKAQKPAW